MHRRQRLRPEYLRRPRRRHVPRRRPHRRTQRLPWPCLLKPPPRRAARRAWRVQPLVILLVITLGRGCCSNALASPWCSATRTARGCTKAATRCAPLRAGLARCALQLPTRGMAAIRSHTSRLCLAHTRSRSQSTQRRSPALHSRSPWSRRWRTRPRAWQTAAGCASPSRASPPHSSCVRTTSLADPRLWGARGSMRWRATWEGCCPRPAHQPRRRYPPAPSSRRATPSAERTWSPLRPSEKPTARSHARPLRACRQRPSHRASSRGTSTSCPSSCRTWATAATRDGTRCVTPASMSCVSSAMAYPSAAHPLRCASCLGRATRPHAH